MSKVDRRILKSQEAIKNALIELMTEKGFDQITIQDIANKANVGRRTFYLHYMDKYDLIDKITEEHMHELSVLCETASEMNYIDAELLWFEYFERHYLFFSLMLASKGAHLFRHRFLELVTEELQKDMNISESEDVTIQFFGAAIVGIVEWWFTNEKPYSPQVMAERVGTILERNL